MSVSLCGAVGYGVPRPLPIMSVPCVALRMPSVVASPNPPRVESANTLRASVPYRERVIRFRL